MSLSAVAGIATVVCETPVEFEFRGELVYISDPCLGVLRAMRKHTFYASFHNAALCMQQCQVPNAGEVVRAFALLDGGKA